MSRRTLGLLAVLAAVAAICFAVPAFGADVMIRVEGSARNLVTEQSTPLLAAPFKPDGMHDCAATSGAAALQTSTGGDWAASYGSLGYFLTTIRGETPSGNDYWSIWINHRFASAGVCDPALQTGDDVLYFVDRCDYDLATDRCTNPPVLPLDATVPRTVAPGSPFTVRVVEYAQDGSASPTAGATVTGGRAAAVTDASGTTTVTVDTPGSAVLRVTKANRAADEATVCGTSGSDGYCDSTVLAGTTPCVTTGDDGLCGTPDKRPPRGKITSVREHQRFARGKGPRTLAGIVAPDPSGIAGIRLRLTRTGSRHSCASFDATRERFVRMSRCGAAHGRWFDVGDREKWSYLLPARLPAGRYVLDVRATDRAGNADTLLQRTRTRVVFTVR